MKCFIILSCLVAFAFGLSPEVVKASPKPPPTPASKIKLTPLQVFLEEIATSQKMMQGFQMSFTELSKPPVGMYEQ